MSLPIPSSDNVPTFQLLQWRAAIKLEMLGMKHSSGRSVHAFAKRVLGLKRSMKREETLAYIQRVLDERKQTLASA